MIKRYIKLFLFSFLVSQIFSMGCAFVEFAPKKGIDKKIEPYVKKALNYVQKEKHSLILRTPINFKNLSGTIIGQCKLSIFPIGVTIFVDYNFWSSSNDQEKLFLLLHEIGHCIYGNMHVKEVDEIGCPISIMYPNLISSFCRRKYSERYLYEFIRK